MHRTGGLADTVTDEYNGFVFTEYTSAALLKTIERTLKAYRNKPVWKMLQRNGMLEDHSSGKTAREYIKLYTSIKGSR